MGKTDTTERSEYGQRLFDARKLAKLSQPEAARRAGMSQSNLSELEKTGQGSAKTARLAEVYGVRVQWLESNKGPMLDTSEIPDQARKIASESVAHHLFGSPAGADYRTIALALAAALEESGTEVTLGQFMKLVEATYAKLRP